MPSLPDVLKIRKEWQLMAEDRERALAIRHLRERETYNAHTRPLMPLHVGDIVSVQNQTGTHPNRWDKTGLVVECQDHSQYVVRLHGSGRCTLRNRRFLRKCSPFCSDKPMSPLNHADTTATVPTTSTPAPDASPQQSLPEDEAVGEPQHGQNNPGGQRIVYPMTTSELTLDPNVPQPLPLDNPPPPRLDTPLPSLPVMPITPRRSTRQRRPTRAFSPSMRGTSHKYYYRSRAPHRAEEMDREGGKGGGGKGDV